MRLQLAGGIFALTFGPVMAVMNLKAGHNGTFLYLLLTLNFFTFTLGILILYFWNKTRRLRRLLDEK